MNSRDMPKRLPDGEEIGSRVLGLGGWRWGAWGNRLPLAAAHMRPNIMSKFAGCCPRRCPEIAPVPRLWLSY
jgi:hypothetical protein